MFTKTNKLQKYFTVNNQNNSCDQEKKIESAQINATLSKMNHFLSVSLTKHKNSQRQVYMLTNVKELVYVYMYVLEGM